MLEKNTDLLNDDHKDHLHWKVHMHCKWSTRNEWLGHLLQLTNMFNCWSVFWGKIHQSGIDVLLLSFQQLSQKYTGS